MNYEVIRAAMQQEIKEPLACYMPNSPGAFIRDRLFKQFYWEEATWFWGAYCRGKFGIFELDELLPKVNALTLELRPTGALVEPETRKDKT
jgi:hypothetical protein